MLGVPICRPGDSLSTRETLLALVDAFDASLRALGRLPDPTAKGGLGIADPVRVCDVARLSACVSWLSGGAVGLTLCSGILGALPRGHVEVIKAFCDVLGEVGEPLSV